MNDRELALKVAWSFLGTPYKWGGDDPMAGFDCSGFIIECLKSPGILPRGGDWTASQLASKFGMLPGAKILIPGDLVFWKNKKKIIHVEMLITPHCSIGAGGGSSKTVTVADAIRQNAYIKVRPYGSRLGVGGFANPFKI